MATAERQEVKAVAKWVRMSPRKARLVVDHIRGEDVFLSDGPPAGMDVVTQGAAELYGTETGVEE